MFLNTMPHIQAFRPRRLNLRGFMCNIKSAARILPTSLQGAVDHLTLDASITRNWQSKVAPAPEPRLGCISRSDNFSRLAARAFRKAGNPPKPLPIPDAV